MQENRARRCLHAHRGLPLHALIAAAVLALLQTGSARADSAVGADTALGNALNPPGRSLVPHPLTLDADDAVRRSPSGQLYGIPSARPEVRRKSEGGWESTADLSLGLLGGNGGPNNALFRTYKQPRTGLVLDHFEAEADHPDSAHYILTTGGGVGQGDPYLGVQFGRYNDWKVKAFYNETRHVFTDTYTALFEGTGTGRLTLGGGLKPLGGAVPVTSGAPTVGTGTCTAAAPCWRYTGADAVPRVYSSATALSGINWTGSATTAAGTPVSPNSIAGALNSQITKLDGNTELALVRTKAGVSAELRIGDRWKAYANVSQERRKGARPFGMNENNYTVEIPEPIDYRTSDFLGGLSYSDSRTQANLRASASLFSNRITSLTVDQPWLAAATGVAAAQTTTFALYPDNKAFNLKSEFARSLPEFFHGRISASAAWGTSQQDALLMLPIDPAQSTQIAAAMGSMVLAGINNPGYALNTLDLRNWDGTNGSPLSQPSARQRIDTQLLNLSLMLQPLDDLSLKGDLRSYRHDNRGGYTAYNPLTGQYGRGFRNSTAFDLVVGSSGDPGAVGVPCYTPAGYASVAGCNFNGNAGVAGQSTNNPANVPVLGPPRDTRQTNLTLSADYTLAAGRSLNAQVERETFHRSFRERDQTWEDKLKLGWVDRSFELATLRMSVEAARRRGSNYVFWPVNDMGTGLPGLGWDTLVAQYLKTAAAAPGWTVAPANLSGYLARYAFDSRKFDQADRDQNVLNARLNVAARDDLDVGIVVQHKEVTFPSSGYGLQSDRQTSLNLDATWQPGMDHQIYGYYNWQNGRRSMRANAGTNAAGANNVCSFAAGSALSVDEAVARCAQQVWLAAAEWNLEAGDRTTVFGLGLQSAVGPLRLGLDISRSVGRTTTTYGYGPNVLTAPQALAAGSAFPDATLTQDTANVQLLVPIDKTFAVRLLYRYDRATVQDWHYDQLPIGASAAENNATLLLDAGPQSYRHQMVGLMLQVKL
jgi:hypothetical protein